MIIQYCSDLHLNFEQNIEYLGNHLIPKNGDILILAGDITFMSFHNRSFEYSLFKYLSENYKYVFYLLGNSEFYDGTDCSLLHKKFFKKIYHNFYIVNNFSICLFGVKFIFSMLGSKILESNLDIIKKESHDFLYLKYKSNPINIDIYNEFHYNSVMFLEHELLNSVENKIIVVTHFVPTTLCSSQRWANNPLNDVFVAKMDYLCSKFDINYWIYGHSHDNIREIRVNNTSFVTNQLGAYCEHGGMPFDLSANFTI